MFKHLLTSRRRPAPRVIRLPDPSTPPALVLAPG